MLPIYCGYDPREAAVYHVFCQSVIENAKSPVCFIPLHQAHLNGFDGQQDGTNAFIFSRYLVPYLQGFEGAAIFVDGDMIVNADINELIDLFDPEYAVQVVKHDYQTRQPRKYIGTPLANDNKDYPRKNWSSFVLWNCGHSETRNLSLRMVNEQSGLYLHRFNFLSDEFVGELPIKFNYLEGWYTKEDEPNPLGVHFTRGGPWFKDYVDVEYGDEWVEMYKNIYKEVSND